MNEAVEVHHTHIVNGGLEECFGVLGICFFKLGCWFGVAYLFHNEDVILEDVGGRDFNARFSRLDEVSKLTLCPRENDFSSRATDVDVALVSLDVFKHAIEVAGFESVNLDYDLGIVFGNGRKDICFFAYLERTKQVFEEASG